MVVGSREVRLARRPAGSLLAEDLVVVETAVPDPGPGEVLVRNLCLSVDAAVRMRLDATVPLGYLPPFQVGEALEGLAVGRVVASRAEGFAEGDLVQHASGFREYALVAAGVAALGGAGALTLLDGKLGPPDVHLGLLGGTGLTAWAGLEVAALAGDDVVWVSSAAGATGSVAAQLARSRGHQVIGSTGGPEKVAYLRGEVGIDAFDYHHGVSESLQALAPQGIDVYFDNVGGEHLEAALSALRPFGRVALCGAVSGYDGGTDAAGPRNLFLATAKNLTLRGFRAGAFVHRAQEARSELAGLWRRGELALRQTDHRGIENAPRALVDLLSGRNIGKTMVHL